MPSSIRFDVAVIGGGPAGLSAAAAAAEGGLRVAVLEKDSCITRIIRTSGVTWASEFDKLGLPRSLCHPIRRYRAYSPNKECILETSMAEAYVLDVKGLYRFLAEQATRSGVEIFLQTRANSASLEKDKSLVKVVTSSQGRRRDFLCSLVIDASGFSSVIGRSLGLVKNWKRYGVGFEYEAQAENVDIESWALMLGKRYSPAGYAWIFPTSDNKVRIGIGVGRPESQINAFAHLKQLLEKRPGPLKELGRIQPLELHSGIVPTEGPRHSTVADRLIMVGDSAGHVNPVLLEGIRFAVKFGRLAGEAAKHAIVDNARKEQLEEYEKRWKREIWKDSHVGLRVQKHWLGLSDVEWDKEVAAMNSVPVAYVLEVYKCRFSGAKFVKLALTHPKLLQTNTFLVVLGAKTRGLLRH